MNKMGLLPAEKLAFDVTKNRINRLREFFIKNPSPEADNLDEWFCYLASFKDEIGNFNNDLSYIATLMAEEFLINLLDLVPFDAAAKAQGAPGLDIDGLTVSGARVVAEIKTTHPYKENDLGAQQAITFKKDALKLQSASAAYKFFFLTDRTTFNVMKKAYYQQMFNGISVVLLPSGEIINPIHS